MKSRIPPLIIIGMHRSGTSMLAGILEELGLFIGAQQIPFSLYESVFFVQLNDWLLQSANASWDNVYNCRFADSKFRAQTLEIVEGEMKSWNRHRFLGLGRSLKYRDIRQINFPWGWKDPRSTINMDTWLRIFPDAKVLHIYRNPLDVAESLRKRELKVRKHKKLKFYTRILRFLSFKAVQTLSVRLMHLEEGIKLWKSYVNYAFDLDLNYGDQVRHICFEDFLVHPEKHIGEIADFAGLNYTDDKVRHLIAGILPDKRFAFLKDPELVQQYEKIKNDPLMQKLGYGNIVSPAAENQLTSS